MANTQLCFILCIALNTIISSNAQYLGIPQSTAKLRAVLRASLELICEYRGGDGNGQFAGWYRDNEPVSSEKQGHYVVKTSNKETKLIIKIFVHNDSLVNVWSVKTNKPGFEEPRECRFGRIPVKRSPQRIETDRASEKLDTAHGSVRRLEDESVTLNCIVEPNGTQRNPVKWTFSSNDKTFSNVPAGVKFLDGNQIQIEQVKRTHRGYYRCSLNDVTFTALLRVKDRFAALWPFLGIVTVVVVLVIIILIFEKRQKATRKAAARDADENDHATEPLVRSTTKSSDNENKKRAVNT